VSEGKRAKLKKTEIKVLAELMKNSRRSDREIAYIVGVSQPTVSRTIKKLEKEGVIKEYTVIPDFARLGYEIMAFRFLGKPETHEKAKREELREAAVKLERETPQSNMIVVDGIGMGKGRLLVNLYRDYGSYAEGMDTIRNLPHVEAEKADSFLVDLCDENNFRVLSMAPLAHHLESQTSIDRRVL
jgi:DNA-binding Lrp family transcriptional regulator